MDNCTCKKCTCSKCSTSTYNHLDDTSTVDCGCNIVSQQFFVDVTITNGEENPQTIYESTLFPAVDPEELSNIKLTNGGGSCDGVYPSGRVIARNLSQTTAMVYTVTGECGDITLEVTPNSEAVTLANGISVVKAFSKHPGDPIIGRFFFDVRYPTDPVIPSNVIGD